MTAHRLGNAGGIGWIRSIIQQITLKPENDFPILWTRVIYSGMHAGDSLTPEEAVQLGVELQLIESANSKAYVTEQEIYWERFIGMMKELVEASRLVGKPISF